MAKIKELISEYEKKKDREDFARRLKAVRKHLNLNQGEFAVPIGYTDGYISLIEGCRARPGYRFFKNIIERFNVNPVYLLTGRGNMFLDEGTGDKIKGYEGPDKEMVIKLVDYIEQVPALRHSVLEFFLRYLYEKADIVEEFRQEYFAKKSKEAEQAEDIKNKDDR